MTPARRILPLAFLGAAALGLSACDDADPNDGPDPIQAEIVTDLPADPATGRDPNTGQPIASGRFTFFSLRDGEIVLSYDDDSRADSNSTQWDLGFRGLEIIANGGANGPGEGGIQVVTGVFENLTEAPSDGYLDGLTAGTDDSWYNYAGPPTHLVTPVPGRVLVVRTADGRYAKVRILSYYRGAPDNPDAFTDEDRYYTFEYVFQPDGSRSFED